MNHRRPTSPRILSSPARMAALLLLLAVAGPARSTPSAQSVPPDPAAQLLDRLAGHWVLTGRIGHKQVTHDVTAEWVLKREYLRLHEVSREKDSNGVPAYEAIIFFSSDPKSQEYTCLWLDSTEGGGLKAETLAHGKLQDHSIPLIFTLASDSIHTTFHYDVGADTWQLTIDNVSGNKVERYADVRLTRAQS